MTTEIEMTKPPVVADVDTALAETARRRRRMDHDHPSYKWIVLSNTTLGALLATAVLVVPFGRLGDMFGRVRTYNLGVAGFTFAASALSFDPCHMGSGALWLIGWRVIQGVGGAMLMASSSAILTAAL